MDTHDERSEQIETTLVEVLDNQATTKRLLETMLEKMQVLEAQLGVVAPEDEYALEAAVDALYDRACTRAETGIHISVPYLMRELQTSPAVAHEIIERLRIDGLLDTGASPTDDDDDGTDVFTTIDLKESTDSENQGEKSKESLVEKARDFVVAEQTCSQTALMQALGISQTVARMVLKELEAAGVVSAPNGRKGREVLLEE